MVLQANFLNGTRRKVLEPYANSDWHNDNKCILKQLQQVDLHQLANEPFGEQRRERDGGTG